MKKSNDELSILKAIGIIAVVSCHLGGNILDILSFPIAKDLFLFSEYSYHIPLFIFASGYFYKSIYENNILELTKKRFSSIKKYLKSNLFYFLLCFIFVTTGMLYRDVSFSFKSLLIEPFLGGFQFYFNGPGWFVPFLFLLQVLFALIRKIVLRKNIELEIENRKNIKIEILFLIFLILIGFVSTMISKRYIVVNDNVLWGHSLLRVLFGMQFYQMGYIYKMYIEDKINLSFKTFIVLIASKFLFILLLGDYTFSLRTLKFNQSVFLPIIVSVLGILYALHLSKFTLKICKNCETKILKSIIFIGENTWSIMMHHLLVKWVLKKLYVIVLIDLNVILFAEYVISPILCILLPLFFSFIYNKEKVRQVVYAMNVEKSTN